MTKAYCKHFTEKIQQTTSAMTIKTEQDSITFFGPQLEITYFTHSYVFTRTLELSFKFSC